MLVVELLVLVCISVCIHANMPIQSLDQNENEFPNPTSPRDTDERAATGPALATVPVPEDFPITCKIFWEVTKLILDDHPVVLGNLRQLSQELLVGNASHLHTIENKIVNRLEHGDGDILMSIFNFWRATSPIECTYNSLITKFFRLDGSLAEKLKDQNTRVMMWQLQQGLTSSRPSQPTADAASSSNTLRESVQPANIILGEEVVEQIPLMEDSGTETMASSYGDVQFAQLSGRTAIEGTPSATSCRITVSESVQQGEDPQAPRYHNLHGMHGPISRRHQHRSKAKCTNTRIGIISIFVIVITILSVLYLSKQHRTTENTGTTITTTANTILVPNPNRSTPIVIVTPSSVPEVLEAGTHRSSPLHTVLNLTNPEDVSSVVTFLLDTTLWLKIFASYNQDWTKYVPPLHCSVENVHVLELNRNLNLKSLHYLLSEYKSIRILIVHGLSVDWDNDQDDDDYDYGRVISLKLLQAFVIDEGQLRPQFYDFFSSTTAMPALQELTIQDSSVHVSVVRPIQNLLTILSNSLIRLNLYHVDVGSQEIFTREICDRFAQVGLLEIINVTLPHPEDVNYQHLLRNLMELRSCQVLTEYIYRPM